MSDTRISAADLLRLAAIASVSPEGTADEVVAILQRTGPAEPAVEVPPAVAADNALSQRIDSVVADAASDKLAKPE